MVDVMPTRGAVDHHQDARFSVDASESTIDSRPSSPVSDQQGPCKSPAYEIQASGQSCCEGEGSLESDSVRVWRHYRSIIDSHRTGPMGSELDFLGPGMGMVSD